ncbi:hypothetical protein [Herpetosiphon gulosus]|uniref:Actin-like protein N-terminal domain-containing protein n=1 Tax=Herpetosiphon gulosus TaxID=1973496 RepID=A0ABP9X5Y8_9CHLR
MTLLDRKRATVYDHVRVSQPLRDTHYQLPAWITIADQPYLAVGDDNGNGAKKIAVLDDKSRLITTRTPTAYKLAKAIRAGQGVITYRVNGGDSFWIGDDALRFDGDALPIGGTSQRLSDTRQRAFNAACMVETLIKARYKPGVYPLAVGFAIPNEEIEARDNDKMGVNPETRAALKTHLNGQTFVVERTDALGVVTNWTLRYEKIIPQAQSIGTLYAWSRTVDGSLEADGIRRVSIVDIGGGDTQLTEVELNPYRMSAERLGAGTISIARELAAKFHRLRLSDAQAQYALETQLLEESGREFPIESEVNAAIQSAGQDLVGRMLKVLQQPSAYVIITGGGVKLQGLRRLIEERAEASGKTAPRNYTIIDPSVADILNATGALLAVVYAAAGKGA